MSLGSAITQARECAGMSVEDLAARTSIRPTLLREFELDNFYKCGGETYARGHVRNIANALAVEPAFFLEIFAAEQASAHRPIHELLLENSVTAPPHEKSRISLKALSMVSASAVVLTVGGQIAYTNFQPTKTVKTAALSAPVVPLVAPSNSPSPEAATVLPVATGVTVEVTATRGDTWLSVSSKAGVALFAGRLSRGDSNSFTDADGINIRFGNAGAVDLLVNGVAVAPPGAVGEVVDASYASNPAN
jgi:cytoskeletal protein RodZ